MEYQINDNDNGWLSWETHTDFCSLKSGNCFIRGDILFIEPYFSKVHGDLKGDFLDLLYKLPKWKRTKYYCSSYRIYNCKPAGKPFLQVAQRSTGNRDDIDINKNSCFELSTNKRNNSRQLDTAEDIIYKLDKYKIIAKNNGQVWWEAHSGMDIKKMGKCFIEGGILFFGPIKTEKTGFMKKEFMQHLVQLPDWKETKYYCPRHAIYCCETGRICPELLINEEFESKKNIVSKADCEKSPIVTTVIMSDFKKHMKPPYRLNYIFRIVIARVSSLVNRGLSITISCLITSMTKFITKVKEKINKIWALFKNWFIKQAN
ncbi:hypothetical protein KJ656_13490 [bacterium]|nr:hypothetical protein [bacterium]